MSIALAMIFDNSVLFDVLLLVLLIAETCRNCSFAQGLGCNDPFKPQCVL
jgi:hypothetical protein